MNAHALLTSQGWRGTGHPLGTRGDGRGLTHRLLMRRNEDGRGLGSRQAEAERRADAWWLNAFDEALKGIDTGSGGATVKQAAGARGGALAAIATPAAKYTGSRGLYSSFVRGGVLEGTLGPQAKKEADAGGLPTPPDSDGGAAARRRPGGRTKARAGETKEERRARRAEKRSRKAEKRARKEGKVKKREEKGEKSKKKKKEGGEEAPGQTETREECRARREARRRRKEEKRRLQPPGG